MMDTNKLTAAQIKRQIKIELFSAIFMWAVGVISFVVTPILWVNNDAGYVRYGIVLPIFFTIMGFRDFSKYRKLKEDLEYGNFTTKDS